METISAGETVDNLNQVPVGRTARVREIHTEYATNQRLMTMGLLPGMKIRVVQIAPLGDPIAVEFNGQHISLRRAEAANIQVEVEPVQA